MKILWHILLLEDQDTFGPDSSRLAVRHSTHGIGQGLILYNTGAGITLK
jgi:hypothetical protein